MHIVNINFLALPYRDELDICMELWIDHLCFFYFLGERGGGKGWVG